jgi:hypothetical protein
MERQKSSTGNQRSTVEVGEIDETKEKRRESMKEGYEGYFMKDMQQTG